MASNPIPWGRIITDAGGGGLMIVGDAATGGAISDYYDKSGKLVGNAAKNAIIDATGQKGTVDGITGFLSALSSPNTWIRVGEVTVGLILTAVAMSALLKGSAAGNVATGAVKTFTPVGRVATGIHGAVGKVGSSGH